MSALFIIGNGFDLAHGIPTRYSDFRKFIVKKYPNAVTYKSDIITLEDFEDIYVDELSAELLLNTMDKVCGSDWNDFESALAHINFTDKFPRAVHKENETEEEDNVLMTKYLLYMDNLTNGFIKCTQLWQDFFRLWIKKVEQDIESGEYKAKQTLKHLVSEQDAKFFSFNYTKTLQVLYGIKKVIHIHNRSGQHLIFGHGEKNRMYDANDAKELLIGSSSLDNLLMSFEKDTRSPLRKYNKFFRKLDSNIDRVYSYGFSYAKVDGIYMREIIKCIAPDAIWHFTKFDAQDKEKLRIKKVKLRNYGFKGYFDIFEG